MIIGGQRTNYLKKSSERHRLLDIKGIVGTGTFPIMLPGVYVEMDMVSMDAVHAPSSRQPIPENLRTGRHSIWEFLRISKNRPCHIVVEGGPGSGKSTLLKWISHALADPRQAPEFASPVRIPILISLTDIVNSINTRMVYTLPDAVDESVAQNQGIPVSVNWIERVLQRGECFVLLDCFDDIADISSRKQVIGWIEQQKLNYPGNLFLIASRPRDWRSHPLTNTHYLEIQPLSSPQQEELAHRWNRVHEQEENKNHTVEVMINAQSVTEDLMRRIHKAPTLARLAGNPLHLALMTMVHRCPGSLPGRVADLFAEACEVFLGKRRDGVGVTGSLKPIQRQQILQHLAYEMMLQKKRDITLEEMLIILDEPLRKLHLQERALEFVKSIEYKSGMLIEYTRGRYRFSHPLIQSFLAAVNVRVLRLEESLARRISDEWWHDTCCFYAGFASDATSLVQMCLPPNPTTTTGLALAAYCLDKDISLHPGCRVRIERVLREHAEDDDYVLRRAIGEALLDLRLERLVDSEKIIVADNSLVSYGEYQFFLESQRSLGKSLFPDHWSSNVFHPGLSQLPLVGARVSDAVSFCDWLTERNGGESRFRLPKPGELHFDPLRQESLAGYWSTDRDNVDIVGIKSQSARLTPEMLQARLNRDLEAARTMAWLLDLNLNENGEHEAPSTAGYSPSQDENYLQARNAFQSTSYEKSGKLALTTSRISSLLILQRFAKSKEASETLQAGMNQERIDLRKEASEIAKELDFSRIISKIISRAEDLQSSIKRTIPQDSFLQLERVFVNQPQLEIDINRTRIHDAMDYRESKTIRSFWFWYIRLRTLAFTKDWQGTYIALAMLEERIAGSLAPFEGIRLVKERVLTVESATKAEKVNQF